MKRPLIAVVAFAVLCCVTTSRLPASSDKVLQNQRGDVSYQKAQGPITPVGASSSVSIEDGATAITGSGSLGAVILPDSSQVLLGSNSRVQLAFFNQAQIATAKFVIYNGKTRFEIRHPKGALANYTFSTSTGQIAVRGTDGDIESSGGSLHVNVYDLTDPNLPVQVTMVDGRSYTLRNGQTLFARYVNGVLVVDVDNVTQQALSAFTDDFGPPPRGPQKPGGGGSPNGPAARPTPPPAETKKSEGAFAVVAIVIAIVLLVGSFFWRPLFKRIMVARYQLGKFRMTAYCERRLAARQIDPHFVGRVLLRPQRTRTERNGRIRRWGFIEEKGMWLRVVSLSNGTVHDAFFDREFTFENRVRPRK